MIFQLKKDKCSLRRGSCAKWKREGGCWPFEFGFKWWLQNQNYSKDPNYWSVILPKDTQSWLRLIFIDLTFKDTEKRLSVCINNAFLWKIWDKRNARIYHKKTKSTDDINNSVFLNVLFSFFLFLFFCKDIPALKRWCFLPHCKLETSFVVPIIWALL